jgi:hypothetical protein
MKPTVLVIAVTCLFISTPAYAARKGFAKIGDSWSLFIRGDELNGMFDTVDVSYTPASGGQFANLASGLNAGVPRAPGEPFTFVNRALDQDPLDGGSGWAIVGRTVTANQLSFAGGPLGGRIDTSSGPQGWLFLANLSLTNDSARPFASGRVQLINAGVIVSELPVLLDGSEIIPNPLVPEPASGIIIIAGALGSAALRRDAARPRPRPLPVAR